MDPDSAELPVGPPQVSGREQKRLDREARIQGGLARNAHCKGGTACTCSERLINLKADWDQAIMLSPAMDARRDRAYSLADEPRSHRSTKAAHMWLRHNVFDAFGNFLYCSKVISATLGATPDALAAARKAKRKERETCTIAQRRAGDVMAEHLVAQVVMPSVRGVDRSNHEEILRWLRSLPPDTLVDVKSAQAHYEHGLQNRRSNRALPSDTFEQFVLFVRRHSSPNGRGSTYRGKSFWLRPDIKTLKEPAKPRDDKPSTATEEQRQQYALAVQKYERKRAQSLTFLFNRAQGLISGERVGSTTVAKWMKTDRLRPYGVMPPKADYCDTCAIYREQRNRCATRTQRLRESGSASGGQLALLERLTSGYDELRKKHVAEAARELDTYRELKSEVVQEEGRATTALPRTAAAIRRFLPYVLSVDFQMGRLVPHFGPSPQPGAFYYRQALVCHTFGVVRHNVQGDLVYLSDEEASGSKDANHVITYLQHVVDHWVPKEYRRVIVYLDGAAYFKNYYVMGWAHQLVMHGRLDMVEFRFMVPGHTKFDPDRLFSRFAGSYSSTEIINVRELADQVKRVGLISDVTVYDGATRQISDWKTPLSRLYRPIDRIKSHNRFVFSRSVGQPNKVLFEVSRTCLDDEQKAYEATIPFFRAPTAEPVPFPAPQGLREAGLWKPLRDDKLANLLLSYSDYFHSCPERWPSFLHQYQSNPSAYRERSEREDTIPGARCTFFRI